MATQRAGDEPRALLGPGPGVRHTPSCPQVLAEAEVVVELWTGGEDQRRFQDLSTSLAGLREEQEGSWPLGMAAASPGPQGSPTPPLLLARSGCQQDRMED